MQIHILHGEKLVASRATLSELLEQLTTQGYEISRIAAPTLTPAGLDQALGETSLFAAPRAVVIEELHSLPVSAKKTELLKKLADFCQRQSSPPKETTKESTKESPPTGSDFQLILWEKRSLTKPMQNKFPGAHITEFKLSSVLFTWLDSLEAHRPSKTAPRSLKLFHQVLETEDVFICFSMLARQIRLLIQAKENGRLAGAPFMIQKLKNQAASFSLAQLLHIHAQLLKLDLAQKTSTDTLTLVQELDLLLLDL